MLIPPSGGKPVAYTRATTVAGTLDDRYSLEKWIQRQTALGLAIKPDLMALVASMDPEDPDKKQLNKICEQATEAAGSLRAANLGVALHSFTESLDLGREVSIPDEFAKHIEAYLEGLKGAEWLEVEPLVIKDDLKIAGSPDRIGMWKGKPTIFDLKTGRELSYSWKSISVQMAIYDSADWIYSGGERLPLPDMNHDVAVIIHLPVERPGEFTLWEVDLEAGREAMHASMAARSWRSRKGLAVQTDSEGLRRPQTVPSGPLRPPWEWLMERISFLGTSQDSKESLLALWPAGIAKPSESTTDEEIDKIVSVLDGIEAQYGMPFGTSDPRITPQQTRRR